MWLGNDKDEEHHPQIPRQPSKNPSFVSRLVSVAMSIFAGKDTPPQLQNIPIFLSLAKKSDNTTMCLVHLHQLLTTLDIASCIVDVRLGSWITTVLSQQREIE